MGEAKRRKPRVVIAPDVRADIATVVRIAEWDSPTGGACFPSAALGCAVLTQLGLDPHLAFGGLLYRCGPDPMRDIVAFCAPDSCGRIVDGRALGHFWIELGDEIGGDLVDFSCSGWRSGWRAAMRPFLRPAAQWTVTPPPYVWAPKRSLFRASAALPHIGEMRYLPAAGPPPDWRALLAGVAPALARLRPVMDGEIERLDLKARLRAAM